MTDTTPEEHAAAILRHIARAAVDEVDRRIRTQALAHFFRDWAESARTAEEAARFVVIASKLEEAL